MELLSIIVPVYNNKKYLCQCVDSILNQTYENLELILVDDGSTDGSGKICDEYRVLDKRVQVIHQKNKGSMYARCQGIWRCQGEYVGFVDSDDWIEPDMYQTLLFAAKEYDCDIISSGYTMVTDNEGQKIDDASLFGFFERGKNLDVLLSNMMYDERTERRGIHPALWSKLFKRELLLMGISEIDMAINLGDDAAIFYPCCLKAEKILSMKEYKYCYRIHSESMCRSMDAVSFIGLVAFYRYLQNVFFPYGKKYDLKKQLREYLNVFITEGLWQVFDMGEKEAYIFPYEMVERGSKIILYGAGKVGKAYWKQLKVNHFCSVIAWADKDKGGFGNIIVPRQILKYEFSKVVIAIEKKEVADEIAIELNLLGVDNKKIVWGQPQRIRATAW